MERHRKSGSSALWATVKMLLPQEAHWESKSWGQVRTAPSWSSAESGLKWTRKLWQSHPRHRLWQQWWG